MTPERLAELRRIANHARIDTERLTPVAILKLADAVDEIERLREVLRDIAYNTSTSIPFAAPPETFIVGQLHSVIGRAARALNPEVTS